MDRSKVDRRVESFTEEAYLGANTWMVAPAVYRIKDLMVNVYLIQNEDATGWVLVDTGLKTTGKRIQKFVTESFGTGSRPLAIIMTHAHFDHRGSLFQLANAWDVPVYCHNQEKPYLSNAASYPPPDPSVGGGAMTILSFAYPASPIDATDYLQDLPANGKIDELPEWEWIHTPGHTPGHLSLFREKDGVLISGDAIVTTMQESLVSVVTQAKMVSGPPKYFTPDWGAAARSVKTLAALEPNVIASGHGHAMYGDVARKQLHKLVKEFWKIGIPANGRYIKQAAQFDESGKPVFVPKPSGTMATKIIAAAALLTLGYIIYQRRKSARGLEKKLLGQVGKTLMTSSLGALGAATPASTAVPAIPMVPAI